MEYQIRKKERGRDTDIDIDKEETQWEPTGNNMAFKIWKPLRNDIPPNPSQRITSTTEQTFKYKPVRAIHIQTTTYNE